MGGAVVQSGLNFNPYFPGTGIAMARVLYDGLVEYEDGTSATTSQMAKDVVEFLNWAAEPEMDDRCCRLSAFRSERLDEEAPVVHRQDETHVLPGARDRQQDAIPRPDAPQVDAS